MSTITVSIGRNVGTTPLARPQWERFRRTVDAAVRDYCDTVFVADAVCVGHWDGVAEESRTWVAEWADELQEPDYFTALLGHIGRLFGQDAVAVTHGTTVLAGLQPVTV